MGSRIDYIFVEHKDFTDKELDRIINYNIKHLMGQEATIMTAVATTRIRRMKRDPRTFVSANIYLRKVFSKGNSPGAGV